MSLLFPAACQAHFPYRMAANLPSFPHSALPTSPWSLELFLPPGFRAFLSSLCSCRGRGSKQQDWSYICVLVLFQTFLVNRDGECIDWGRLRVQEWNWLRVFISLCTPQWLAFCVQWNVPNLAAIDMQMSTASPRHVADQRHQSLGKNSAKTCPGFRCWVCIELKLQIMSEYWMHRFQRKNTENKQAAIVFSVAPSVY